MVAPDDLQRQVYSASQARLSQSRSSRPRAKADVDKNDENSLYCNFYQTVTDPAFSGILAVNCNMQLDLLPPAIRAVLGGMKDPGIAGFRVHHVGVAINDTDPAKPT